MTPDEIVKALRWLAKETEFTFAAENLNGAADLIESLQARVAKLENRIAAEGFYDLETMISKYKTVMLAANEISIKTDEELEELRAQLAASQRRADAAKEDARQGSVCRTCHYLNNGCEPLNLDAGCHKWQWRGPQEAGKGDNNA